MKKYKQLNLEERVTIKILLQQGNSIRGIAKQMGRSPSTIHREICRGITVDRTYFAESTERLIRQRKLNDKRKRKMDNPAIYSYVACRLKNKIAPAIIQHDIERDIGSKIGKDAAFLTSSSIVFALSEYNITHIHSITYDNGCEFAGHEDVNKELQCQSYFCNAYHSWEKGLVGNVNGLIRRFFPKGTNFDNITDEQIKRIENWINNRSMKILGWKSPNEVFNGVAL